MLFWILHEAEYPIHLRLPIGKLSKNHLMGICDNFFTLLYIERFFSVSARIGLRA
jgi:hypothetical protein